MRRVLTIYMVLFFCLRLIAADVKSSRDPFWPVGFKRPDPKPLVAEVVSVPTTNTSSVTAVDPPKPDPLVIEKLAAELQVRIRQQCQVSGFWKSSGGQQMAIVNGQIRGVGDKVAVDVDGQTYRFKVTAISPMSVKMEPVD